jgi:deoxycytidylate deaminase
VDSTIRQVFKELAALARDRSTDPSTQNAARWGRYDYVQAANVAVVPPLDDTRDAKLWVTEHAERGAIFAGLREMAGGALGKHGVPPDTMYALWAACPECARAIVLAGITRVVTLDMPSPDRWKAAVAEGDRIMTTRGVRVERYPLPDPRLGVTIRFDGKELEL